MVDSTRQSGRRPDPGSPAAPVPGPDSAVENEGGGAPVEERPSEHVQGSTRTAGRTIDEGKGRTFPCEGCGADLAFSIGQQAMQCPYCGRSKALEIPEGAAVGEQDFSAMLERIAALRAKGKAGAAGASEVECDACGGTTVFTGTLTSTECPYCGKPIQRSRVHDAEDRVPADGVLPFQIDRPAAAKNLKAWVTSRWFAPNEFLRLGVSGTFNGVYLPYWTYDAMTSARFSGFRGDHYYTTEGVGKRQRRVRHTRWWPVSGAFQRFFDDVLVCAAAGLPRRLLTALEPWPLAKCIPFTPEVLAGYLARTYDIPLEEGFANDARARIEAALRAEARARIGGDVQRITSMETSYGALTYKHLLLPVWLLGYRYKGKAYQVAVNAGTGEVQGERPYSWVKILLAALAGAAAALLFALLHEGL